ncbi:hypothetical protein SLEP1_g20252 [Rubroshorea leprosula]|uniref:DUF569 domain-containing protein n=1 Tax=Rubroshorea leprosula TaxID=152421 RepID=A0AAV5J228_9ROSI|nr:hypothetical protein SLEP1_g20252 [Rubroshorea leprosula]
MEIFQKAEKVRLRSHHDKYLLADDDEESVSQDRDGTLKNAQWTVELVENADVIRLKSFYGKYLTASNMPFLLGMTGKKVLQTVPRRLDSSVEWEPIREGVQVRLKTRYGQYLRGNGGLPPWRNSITHDIPHRTATQDWILWDVDVIQFRRPKQQASPKVQPPPPPPPELVDRVESEPPSPTAISLRSPKMTRLESDDSFDVSSPAKIEGRLIHYEVVDEDGEVDEAMGQRSSTFKGSGVEELKEMLKEETGLNEIFVCSRNPLNGKLYPLRLHLPPNNVTMRVVVVPSYSKVATEFEA